jgi:hypothetical protein
MPDAEKYDFLLKLLKDELTAQANVFDQIDNKTGVALGFTFVAVGQVLASVFRIATDQNHFRTLHPHAVGSIFLLANMSVFLAIIFGATARWPRSFEHTMEWSDEALDDSLLELRGERSTFFRKLPKRTTTPTSRRVSGLRQPTYVWDWLCYFI